MSGTAENPTKSKVEVTTGSVMEMIDVFYSSVLTKQLGLMLNSFWEGDETVVLVFINQIKNASDYAAAGKLARHCNDVREGYFKKDTVKINKMMLELLIEAQLVKSHLSKMLNKELKEEDEKTVEDSIQKLREIIAH
eukprot:TRINITY_DN99_c0_g3_i1.p1 TRINITY_DN99_c0_g3~~TRINITY_DN99_c0_g3_i1.p1  ORF type:complete len:137 (-),score=39.51 TRINITY_DN99_c0_g3_i1:41-451(-)